MHGIVYYLSLERRTVFVPNQRLKMAIKNVRWLVLTEIKHLLANRLAMAETRDLPKSRTSGLSSNVHSSVAHMLEEGLNQGHLHESIGEAVLLALVNNKYDLLVVYLGYQIPNAIVSKF